MSITLYTAPDCLRCKIVKGFLAEHQIAYETVDFKADAQTFNTFYRANRKAIALANGATAATVRAGAYYNIARIYEAAGQFADALRHYQLAKEQKANPVYDTAIERVQNR